MNVRVVQFSYAFQEKLDAVRSNWTIYLIDRQSRVGRSVVLRQNIFMLPLKWTA